MDFFERHLLTLVWLGPLAGMVPLLLIPPSNAKAIRWWSSLVMLATFLASLALVRGFFGSAAGPQFRYVESYAWIPSLGARYLLGIDGISLLLIELTTLFGLLAITASGWSVTERPRAYCALVMLLETSCLGTFMALDLFLFFVFWGVTLVPVYFILAGWGGPRRLYAAMKFFLYTLFGSFLMLVGILALYVRYHADTGTYSLSLIDWTAHARAWPEHLAFWVFWAFTAAFAVKIPMLPFHTWLLDAQVEAPTAVVVMLAGVLLKTGTYGFLRFCLPIVPTASSKAVNVEVMVVLSIVAIFYGALLSLMQREMKQIVVCSSISQLGFCTLGIFALTPRALAGSVIQQVNHGLWTAALLLLVASIERRCRTSDLRELGGLGRPMPVYAVFFSVAVLASVGLPPLSGFVGYFAILQGVFEANWRWAIWGVAGAMMGATYPLWLYQRAVLGARENSKGRGAKDLNWGEVLTLTPLTLLIAGIGLYPRPLLNVLQEPVAAIVESVRAAADGVTSAGLGGSPTPASPPARRLAACGGNPVAAEGGHRLGPRRRKARGR